MYQALYRKYRPRTFSDVVGQRLITETLRRQIETGRLSHAYLFVGTRGTGKTTCAKILSRALNCEHPINGDPCNQCDACRGIEDGSILDVVEIDAASNNGVDNVRSLREEAVYTPVSVKKRVYIIDEVHMLSTSAFNALLKILEEPPEHLVFILATTELRKIPATILSRCQRFSFKRIAPEDIEERLRYIADQEGFTLTPQAASLLARLADGSMRDALSLLDQCVVSDTVDQEDVRAAVGLLGSGDTEAIWRSAAAGDVRSALKMFQKMYKDGGDPVSALGDMLSLCRDILVARTAPESGDSLLSGVFSSQQLLELGSGISVKRLLAASDTLQEAISDMNTVKDKRTGAELCIIKLCGTLAEGPQEWREPPVDERRTAPQERPAPQTQPAPQEKPRTQPPKEPQAQSWVPPWEDDQPAEKAEKTEQQSPAAAAYGNMEPEDYQEEPPEDSVPWDRYLEEAESAPEEPEPEADTPQEAPPQPEKPAEGGDWWGQVLAACRGKIEAAPFTFLSDRVNLMPQLNGSSLVMRAKNDFVLMMVDNTQVKSAVAQAASQVLMRSVSVTAAVGFPEETGGEDKLDSLLKFGNIRFE